MPGLLANKAEMEGEKEGERGAESTLLKTTISCNYFTPIVDRQRERNWEIERERETLHM